MVDFNKLKIKFDVKELKEYLETCDLWGEYPQRGLKGSPHEDMKDIWVRYKNPAENIESGDWSNFADEHESEWLKEIPFVKTIANALMGYLDGERLGGILITRLPNNGEIKRHVDSGWHAEYYDKYYIPIKNNRGAMFCFESGKIEPEEGEVYAFRNDVPHWVINKSGEDRIAMIICIKQTKLSKGGLCLGDTL